MKKIIHILCVLSVLQLKAQIVSTYAGLGGSGAFLDGPNSSAQFNNPKSISAVANNSVFVADINNNRIRMISSGTVSTWAGNGIPVHAEGTGTAASFATIRSIATRTNGVVYVNCGDRVRIIGTTASTSTYLTPSVLSSALGSAPNIQDIAFDPTTNTLYLADASGFVLKSTSSGSATLWASTGSSSNYVSLLAYRPAGGLIGSKANGDIVLINTSGSISTIIPTVGANGITVHPVTGDILVSKGNQVLDYESMSYGLQRTFCMTGPGNSDGVASLSKLNLPCDLSFSVVNPAELFVADVNNNKVRKIEYVYSGPGITGVVNPPNKTGCENATVTLTVSAANATDYQWAYNGAPISNGSDYSGVNTATLNINNFNAGLTGTYTAYCANTYTTVNSPANTGVITIAITPTISNAGPSQTVCPGQLTGMNTSGIGIFSYSWSNGANSAYTTVTPTATSIYTVNAYNSGATCYASQTVTITVKPVPDLSVTATSSVLCSGQTTSLSVSGANSYTWSTGDHATDIAVSPSASTLYTVVGTGTNNCNGTASYSVTVNNLPVLSLASSNTLLCTGSSADLSVTGAQTYTWSTAEFTNTITVSPTVTTSYTVMGTDANGCENVSVITQSVSLCTAINNKEDRTAISVYPNPASDLICIHLTSKVSSAFVYSIDGQLLNMQSLAEGENKISLSGLAGGIYVVTVTDGVHRYTYKIIKQ